MGEHWLEKQILLLSGIFAVVSLAGIGLIHLVLRRPATGPEGLICEAIALIIVAVISYYRYAR
jgi:hypothetical protein